MPKTKEEIKASTLCKTENSFLKHTPDDSHNVAIYIHAATLSNNSLYSFELQESELKRYISVHPLWNLIKVYKDSGKDRSERKKMIAECNDTQVDMILVKSISRISRSLTESIEIIRQFRTHGIGFYCITEDLYTIDPHIDQYIQLAEMLATEESRKKSAHICGHLPFYRNLFTPEDTDQRNED